MTDPFFLRVAQFIFWDLGHELCTRGARQIGGKCLIAFWPKLGSAFLRKHRKHIYVEDIKECELFVTFPI